MSFQCLGCGRDIAWDGVGTFSYTCTCGARVFYETETRKLALPASFILNAAVGPRLPHLNGLVGESDYTSPVKEQLIKDLRAKGYIWMEECGQCKKDGTLQKKLEREKHLALREAERILRQGAGGLD